jgi:hypothetical protein
VPGEAVPVLEPAALPFAATIGQPVPVIVDLVPGLAVDPERDRLVERELRAAVDADEPLAVRLELHGHHGAGGSRPGSIPSGAAA